MPVAIRTAVSGCGIQAVGVDRIVAEAGVAKATLYKHFRSKDALVVAALDRRDRLWTQEWLRAEVEKRGGPPGDRLLAIFDVFGPWFREKAFEGCFFINALAESRAVSSTVGKAAVAGLAEVRRLPQGLAEEAAVADPETFAQQWQILMSGSIVLAGQGIADAATRARDVGALVLAHEGVGATT